jgi:hypothetical protein
VEGDTEIGWWSRLDTEKEEQEVENLAVHCEVEDENYDPKD